MTSSDVTSHIPLTPGFLHLLLALAAGPSHGYQMMKEVELRSGGRVRIGPGSLYESVQRLLDKGLIEIHESDERRHYYRLTRLGRAVLRAETARLADLVSYAGSLGI